LAVEWGGQKRKTDYLRISDIEGGQRSEEKGQELR
jgi:hypothetical protein